LKGKTRYRDWKRKRTDRKVNAILEDAVEQWHFDPNLKFVELHEFLGMTWGEYVVWTQTGAIPERVYDLLASIS
jgi:hypothetical protein